MFRIGQEYLIRVSQEIALKIHAKLLFMSIKIQQNHCFQIKPIYMHNRLLSGINLRQIWLQRSIPWVSAIAYIQFPDWLLSSHPCYL